MEKKFKTGDRVYHRNLKQYGNIYNGGPCVEDEYVDEYNLPNEYRLSIKK